MDKNTVKAADAERLARETVERIEHNARTDTGEALECLWLSPAVEWRGVQRSLFACLS